MSFDAYEQHPGEYPFFPRLEEAARSIGETLMASEDVRILTHYDGDGTAAGAIMATFLLSRGKPFQLSAIEGISEDLLEDVATNYHETVLVIDLGIGRLDVLRRLGKRVIIIDHHPLEEDITDQMEDIIMLHPRALGLDEVSDCSASTLAYMVAVTMNHKLRGIISSALAGAWVDGHLEESPSGLNRLLLEEAKARGLMQVREEFTFVHDQIPQAMVLDYRPYYAQLALDDDAGEDILRTLGISPGKWRDLPETDVTALSSMLTVLQLDSGVSTTAIRQSRVNRYWFPAEKMDCLILGRIFDACGRNRRNGLGMGLVSGDSDGRHRGMMELLEFQRYVMDRLKTLRDGGVQSEGRLRWFMGDDPRKDGVVADVLANHVYPSSSAVLFVSEREGSVVIAGRRCGCSDTDLGSIFTRSLEGTSGQGAGNPSRAGARLPSTEADAFLETLKKELV